MESDPEGSLPYYMVPGKPLQVPELWRGTVGSSFRKTVRQQCTGELEEKGMGPGGRKAPTQVYTQGRGGDDYSSRHRLLPWDAFPLSWAKGLSNCGLVTTLPGRARERPVAQEHHKASDPRRLCVGAAQGQLEGRGTTLLLVRLSSHLGYFLSSPLCR